MPGSYSLACLLFGHARHPQRLSPLSMHRRFSGSRCWSRRRGGLRGFAPPRPPPGGGDWQVKVVSANGHNEALGRPQSSSPRGCAPRGPGLCPGSVRSLWRIRTANPRYISCFSKQHTARIRKFGTILHAGPAFLGLPKVEY